MIYTGCGLGSLHTLLYTGHYSGAYCHCGINIIELLVADI
jgi:hypothetical protein